MGKRSEGLSGETLHSSLPTPSPSKIQLLRINASSPHRSHSVYHLSRINMDAIRSTAATATAAATSVFSFPAFVYTEIRGAISDWLRPPSPNVHIKLESGARFSSDFSKETDFHMKGGEIARLTFSRSSYDGKCDNATVTVSRCFISIYPPRWLPCLPRRSYRADVELSTSCRHWRTQLAPTSTSLRQGTWGNKWARLTRTPPTQKMKSLKTKTGLSISRKWRRTQ
jgi:hypothetical protein